MRALLFHALVASCRWGKDPRAESGAVASSRPFTRTLLSLMIRDFLGLTQGRLEAADVDVRIRAG